MGHTARLLPDGKRLHLQHGPIDLVIGADGDRTVAFAAARDRFATVLQEIVTELPDLRRPLSPACLAPRGQIPLRMHAAASRFCAAGYLTRMAAVAGAVADEVLQAMTRAADLQRAYVNNGGDIAVHLTEGQSFTTAMADQSGRSLGRITLRSQDGTRGIATSGRHGRSLSLGIADSVTVLAASAALADVAATLIANAVDLPQHPAVSRRPACEIVEDSDLGALPVVTGCGHLSVSERRKALDAGSGRAMSYVHQGSIHGAALFLQGEAVSTSGQITLLHNGEMRCA